MSFLTRQNVNPEIKKSDITDVFSKFDVSRAREIVVKDVADKDLPRFYGNLIGWSEFKSTFDLTIYIPVRQFREFSENSESSWRRSTQCCG